MFSQTASSAKRSQEPTAKSQVSAARAKLAASSGGPVSYSYELLLLYARNQLNMSLAIPALVIILAAVSSWWVNPVQLSIWLSVVLLAQGMLLYFCKKFASMPEQEVKTSRWGWLLTFVEFVNSVSWAALIGLLWEPTNIANHMFVFALVIVIVSIRMMLASHALPIVIAGMAPLTGVLATMFIMQKDLLHLSLAAVAIIAAVFFLILARNVLATTRNMIEFRSQKDALISELEELNAKSEESRRHAEDANLAKSRFLATMSHELRTPLNAIMGFADIMQTEMLGQHSVPAYKDYSKDIHQSGKHLLKLINEILDLSRIEAGRYSLKEEPVDIGALGHECIRLIQLRARERGVDLLTNFEPGIPYIRADEKAIRQIWINLLSNAVKFTPTGGRIYLTVTRAHNGGVAMKVRDTGTGIRPEEIPQILSPFGQGSDARKRAEDGAGLGLPIVSGLAELHGAELHIRSKLRHGSEVSVIFPANRVINDTNTSAPIDMDWQELEKTG